MIIIRNTSPITDIMIMWWETNALLLYATLNISVSLLESYGIRFQTALLCIHKFNTLPNNKGANACTL